MVAQTRQLPMRSHWHAKRRKFEKEGTKTHRRKGIVFSSSLTDDPLDLDRSLSVDTVVAMINCALFCLFVPARKDSHMK